MSEPTSKPRYIIIAGPTAAGKTAAAVELALLIGGEVISADSMQIYKFMDIGTAKPKAEDLKGVPHYLIDELCPGEHYSAYGFKARAEPIAADISARGKHPIICGGTGFYINALINGTDFVHMAADEDIRRELYALAEKEGAETLHRKLEALDPEGAAEIHPNNIKRVIRALEFYKQTGTPISAHNTKEREKIRQSEPKNAKYALLTMDRVKLYDRINKRVDSMVNEGLEKEVRGLLERGYSPDLPSMQGLGYKEMVRYIRGECSLDQAADAIKIGTRRYAKRQWTWFSRQIDQSICYWYDVEDFGGPRDLAERIKVDLL